MYVVRKSRRRMRKAMNQAGSEGMGERSLCPSPSGFLGDGLQGEFPAPFILGEDFIRSSYQVPFRLPCGVRRGISLPQDAVLEHPIGSSPVSKNCLNFVIVFAFDHIRWWPRVVFSVFFRLRVRRE